MAELENAINELKTYCGWLDKVAFDGEPVRAFKSTDLIKWLLELSEYRKHGSPALLAEVDRLEAENKRLAEERNAAVQCIDELSEIAFRQANSEKCSGYVSIKIGEWRNETEGENADD